MHAAVHRPATRRRTRCLLEAPMFRRKGPCNLVVAAAAGARTWTFRAAVWLATVERFEERADGGRVVLLGVALQVCDQRSAPPSVHQFDGDQTVHGRPDEVGVGRRVGEIWSPVGDARRE